MKINKSTPEAQGVSSQGIIDFIDALALHEIDINSLIIIRNNTIITQGYYEPFNAVTKHQLYSLSKSFTSTAIGFAIEEGYLSLDSLVKDILPDKCPEKICDELAMLNIEHLLTMNAGFEEDSINKMQAHPNSLIKAILSSKFTATPGTRFMYDTGATYILSVIVKKVTGEDVNEYLTPRLYDKLDIQKPTWDKSQEDISFGGFGLYLKTMDIAKFGMTYLNMGKFNGVQVIPKSWVENATTHKVPNSPTPEKPDDWGKGYGYQFWRSRHDSYRGDGMHGQFCVVMPKKNMVVAITSSTNKALDELNLIWETILPCIYDEQIKENPKVNKQLIDKLNNLSMKLPKTLNYDKTIEQYNAKYVLETSYHDINSISIDFDKDYCNATIWYDNNKSKLKLENIYGKWAYCKDTFNIKIFGNAKKLKIASSISIIGDNKASLTIRPYQLTNYINIDIEFSNDSAIFTFNDIFDDKKAIIGNIK